MCSGAEWLQQRCPRGLLTYCSPIVPAAVGPSRWRSVRSNVHPRLLGYTFLLVSAFKLPVLASTWQVNYFILFYFIIYFSFSVPLTSFYPYHNQDSEIIEINAALTGRSMTAALCPDGFFINNNYIRHFLFTGTLMRYYPCFVLC